MLNNLFKVSWKWKNADIIIWYKLTLLVSLYQGNVKKSIKLMKIDENRKYWQRNSSKLLNDLKNFNEVFRKDVTYDNTKIHKKPAFHPLFRRHIFRKTTGGGQVSKFMFKLIGLSVACWFKQSFEPPSHICFIKIFRI